MFNNPRLERDAKFIETADGRAITREDRISNKTCMEISYKKDGNWSHVPCNNKGLPMPQSLDRAQCFNKSLAEMRAMHYEAAPYLPYQVEGARLSHLDARMESTPTLNELDRYL